LNNENDRLDSWKEIAQHTRREIRTCFRWYKELNFPIYHIDKKSLRSRVFSYKSEIDRWFIEKKK
jgi:predicted DNA-binding transcriptional regulator AlpA